MENKKRECSTFEHEDNFANIYCEKCEIYMCNKCENHHSKLFINHKIINLDKEEKDEIFNGFCKEKKHNYELEFFCKTHNQLCCAICLCKIKKKRNWES